MKHSDIRKLYNFIYDELFAGEFLKPPLVIHYRPDANMGLYNDYGEGTEIEVFPVMHDDDAELADTLTHEFIHARQAARGRKLNHGKWFKRHNRKAFRKLKAIFNET